MVIDKMLESIDTILNEQPLGLGRGGFRETAEVSMMNDEAGRSRPGLGLRI